MINTLLQNYYAQHSLMTQPGEYASLFDDLPTDVTKMVQVIHGLLISPYGGQARSLPSSQKPNGGFGLRRVSEMLAVMLQLNEAPLIIPRPPEQRLAITCRNFAVLLVSMLRHQGIPARLRVGFAGYFGSPLYYDHRLAEYWDDTAGRWILADAMVEPHRVSTLPFAPLDIQPQDPFYFAGQVWQACRAAKLSPEQFADSPTDKGWPVIRYALLHDLDALNKMELLGCDAWHPLIDKPEAEISESERALLNQIAEMTIQADSCFDELHTLYQTTTYGQTVQAHFLTLS